MTRGPGPLVLPDPPLADAELALRPWRVADAEALAAAWRDPSVARWTGVPPTVDLATAVRWIDGEAARRQQGLALDLVIELAGDLVGEVGLARIDAERRAAEIGWWVGEPWRGRGIATRSTALVATWAVRSLGIQTLVARCHPGNPASGRVAAAAGFERRAASGEHELWIFGYAAGATLGT